MEEIWKDIKEYNGYQVSNLGRVRTFNKTTFTTKHGVRHWENRILKPREDIKNRSLSVSLWKNGKNRSHLIHRLVAETFIPNPDNKPEVNHIDGDRHNNKLDNLEWTTKQENMQHAFRTGLCSNQIKIMIEDKITGTIIYPSSLSEGSKIINKNHGYLSTKIKNSKFENSRYKWELIK